MRTIDDILGLSLEGFHPAALAGEVIAEACDVVPVFSKRRKKSKDFLEYTSRAGEIERRKQELRKRILRKEREKMFTAEESDRFFEFITKSSEEERRIKELRKERLKRSIAGSRTPIHYPYRGPR